MSSIVEARSFVTNLVQGPALNSELPSNIKSKVKNSDIWLGKFKRVGDLLIYLRRFKGEDGDQVYQTMKAHGLKTFEDILPEFERKFDAWAHDRTRLSDFVVGDQYGAYDILIFANNYDTRSGGMFVLTAGGAPAYVVIKATLDGGMYANEWLTPGHRLKYFLKSRKGMFNENFSPNSAILNTPGLPVVTFVRSENEGPFTYHGIFQYETIVREPDESKYFILVRKETGTEDLPISAPHLERSFKESVKRSLESSRDDRRARLAAAPKKPELLTVVTTSYRRNADVVAEVLDRARGCCEICLTPAPFARRSDGSPYLEVHHRIRLADGGEDTVENAIALCPNCHREAHYGSLQL